MNTLGKDKEREFGRLIKSIRLESPGADFSARVMDRVFEEQLALDKVKSDRIFGRSFLIILAIFVALMVASLFLTGSMETVDSLRTIFPAFNSDALLSEYRSLFNRLDLLPASLAGILLASSLLVFIDRILLQQLRVNTSFE